MFSQIKPRGRKHAAPTPSIAISSLYGEGRQVRAYNGEKAKLVLGIDIGTTFSAASFCVLRPRCPPNLEIVSSWPGQTMSDAKVPSVLFYGPNGTVTAWGAQTTNQDTKALAAESGWAKAQWFKLALRPPHLPAPVAWPTAGIQFEVAEIVQDYESSSIALEGSELNELPSFPEFFCAHTAYSTFLCKIFEHIRHYFCKHHSSGYQLWDDLFPTLEVVFTIPNGWELKQHQMIRSAAVAAGMMGRPDYPTICVDTNLEYTNFIREQLMDQARERIKFVSEAEAAMVYAADSGYVDSWLRAGNDVIMCDAGGGTIDITAYTIVKERPLELREKVASKCVIAGAVLVNKTAEDYLWNKVRGTTWDTPTKIDQLMEEFERDTKKRFGSTSGEYGIGSGGSSEYIKPANIRNGRLYIPGRDFAKFFEPTLEAIKSSIMDVYKQSGKTAKNVIMVGGFMNSSYAYENLEAWGREKGLKFTKPDGVMAKAVSHGALLWYLAKPVKGYITKVHYGSDVSIPIDELQEDIRGKKVVARPDGEYIVENVWESIACMGEELNPKKEVIREFEKYFDEDDTIEESMFEEKVYICRQEEVPRFMVSDDNGHIRQEFEHVCSIVVDLRELFNITPWNVSDQNKKRFKILEFNISIVNDGYDIKAFATWKVRGRKHRGEARVILPDGLP